MRVAWEKFEIFSPTTMQWRDGPVLPNTKRGFNVGSDFYVRDWDDGLWKFNVAKMEFESATNPGALVSTVVPVPKSFAVCS